MTSDEALALYSRLADVDKVRFMLHLCNRLTIIAREAYFRCEITDPAKLIKLNEFQHRLTRIAADLLEGQSVRTDREVVEHVLIGFSEHGAEGWIAGSLSRVSRRGE